MGYPVNIPEVGEKVYQIGSPQKAGIIREIVTNGKYFDEVRVEWLNGKIEIVSSGNINRFEALIADLQKKLKTHLATLAKLEAL
jgi:hypothetical protein